MSLPFFFGIAFSVIIGLMPDSKPLMITALRSLPGPLLVLVALGLAKRLHPSRQDLIAAAGIGLLNFTAVNALLISGTFRTPGGLASVLANAWPLFVAIASIPVLRQRPTPRKWLAVVVMTVGLAIAAGSRMGTQESAVGALELLGSALALTVATLLTARLRLKTMGGVEFVMWQGVIGGAVAGVLSLTFEAPWTVPISTDLLAGTVILTLGGGVIAYVSLFHLTRSLDPLRASAVAAMAPIVGIAAGILLQGESANPTRMTGMLLAVGGGIATAWLPSRELTSSEGRPSEVGHSAGVETGAT